MLRPKCLNVCDEGKYGIWLDLKGTNMQQSGHMGQNFQTELKVEIYSKRLVRAIGKV